MGEMNPEDMLNCDDKKLIAEINKQGIGLITAQHYKWLAVFETPSV